MYILRKNFLSKVYPLRRVQIKVSQKPDYALKLQNCEGFLYGNSMLNDEFTIKR